MKKLFVSAMIGICTLQATVHGGQSSESKYQKKYYEVVWESGKRIKGLELSYWPSRVKSAAESISNEICSLPPLKMQDYIDGFFDELKISPYPKFQWDIGKEKNKTKIGKYGRFIDNPEQLWPKGNYGAMGECRAYELKKAIKYFNTYRAS